MIILAGLTFLASMNATPEPASVPAANRTERQCAVHHLPIPPGKGLVTTIMRCTERPVGVDLSLQDKRVPEAPKVIPNG